jgi:hypothetical protein
VWSGLLAVSLTACSSFVGGEVALPDTTSVGGNAVVEPVAEEQDDQDLRREVFMYRGSERDPFRSLAISGPELRPFLEDLRVASIIFDARYPARSVAVLLDMDDGTRYSVRVDDEFGRLRVFEIRAYEIVLTIEDFGVPRQVVLSIRRRQEGN